MPTRAESKEEKSAALPFAGLEALTVSGETGENSGTTPRKSNTSDDDDDKDLFKPPPPQGECPLCLILLPIDIEEVAYKSCCGNLICNGCKWKHMQVLAATNAKRALKDPPESPLEDNCAFCRAPRTKTNEEMIERIKARMELGDPEAFEALADCYTNGELGLPQDTSKAFELCLRAVELGSADACFNLACHYRKGYGVQYDMSKVKHYAKLAAKKGHVQARHNLGYVEDALGNHEIAVRHWMISASAGHDESLQWIEFAHRKKYATKEQFEMAIRAKHKAKKEMASEERDKARAARAARAGN